MRSFRAGVITSGPAVRRAGTTFGPGTNATMNELGLHMPAEWEPHEATWIAWPHNRDDWPGKFEAIPWVYAEIVRHLHQSERVRILVNNARAEERARQVLSQSNLDWDRIEFFHIRTNRVWSRV